MIIIITFNFFYVHPIAKSVKTVGALYIPTIMKHRSKSASVSKLQILEVISDQICINIFNTIANDSTNSENLMKLLNLTRKQYYERSSRLLKTGLIRKEDGGYNLTSFGRLVYHSQLKIASALERSSELKAIDVIRSDPGISEDQRNSIIDKLIDDLEIKMLIT